MARTKFTKPDVHVYLKKDVDGLGRRASMIRNYLLPLKLAYYVPRVAGKPLLPEGWTQPLSDSDLGIEAITPAQPSAAFDDPAAPQTVLQPAPTRARADGVAAAESRTEMSPEQRRALDVERRDMLLRLGRITFHRVRIDPESDKIFGSVSPYDISLLLEQQHAIHIDRNMIFVDQNKIKRLGTHSAEIRFSTELPPLMIEVVVDDVSE
nr:hypothetical protein HK105_006985 [Polyrhizophydium stewartii]